MMKPFLLFILGDPRSSTDLSLKNYLQSVLLDTATLELYAEDKMQDSLLPTILDFLTSLLSFYKLDSNSIGQTTVLVHQQSEWFIQCTFNTELLSSSRTKQAYLSNIKKIVDHLLSLCSARLRNSLDVMSTLLAIRRIQKHVPEVFVTPRTLWAINVLLVESPTYYSLQLLNIWKEIIAYRTEDLDIHAASLGAVIPLLQLLSSNCQQAKQLATKCFAQLDVFRHHKDKEKYQEMLKELSKEPSKQSSPVILPSNWLVQMDVCASITSRILRDSQTAITWLAALKTSLSSCKDVPSHVSMILSVILVMPDPRVTCEVLKVMPLVFSAMPSQVRTVSLINQVQGYFGMLIDQPSQHGADLLGLLTTLISRNARHLQTRDDSSSVVVILCLQGIQALCQAEVVDLCTAWQVLAPKLAQDTRPAVIKGLCVLFSLTPSLATDTKEYEEFKSEVLVFLWKLTQHEEPFICGAAFAALSKFEVEDFKLLHLPEEILQPIREKLMSSKQPSSDEDAEILEQTVNNSSPPGEVYVTLLSKIHSKSLPDFQTFLTSLLQREVASIPRGLIHNAMRANPSHDRALAGIPTFLQAQYDKSKTPGLNTGLAVGLLFCFEPPFEQHEGKRGRRYHVDCARSYRHMLGSLLHEVPIQPSEWHRNLLLPQAWTVFMTRLYNTCVQGRKEELALQFSHGHITDEKELNEKQTNAWMVTRDILTEQLQSASRGNPSVQGNSVLALAGLAFAVCSHTSQDSAETTGSNQSDGDGVQGDDRQRMRDWLCVIADTLMAVLDGNYKAKTSLVWCQQVSSPTSTASSLLARACAALALSQLVPVLVTLEPDRVKTFTEALKHRVPGQPKAGSSSVIQNHCSLGLGLLLNKLYQEHFSELAGKEGYMIMATALDVLEGAALSADLENTEGACLGMGLALSALCRENIVDSRVHLLTMHQKLIALIQDYGQETADQRLQSLSFSFSLVSVNAYHTGIISGEDATQCVLLLKDLSSKNVEAVGMALSLGCLLHGLVTSGHAGVTDFVTQQLKLWETWIENEELPSLQQLAGVNGLMGLLGSEQALLQMDVSATDAEIVGKGKSLSILKTLKSIISSPHDVGVAANIAWLLGHIYSAATSNSISKTSVPANYSYLPEKSILRAVFDFLLAAGKTGPHLHFSSHVINSVLVGLVTGPEVALPPVNWASVLGPIMRSSFGQETNRLCLQFAVTQAKSSSSLISFLSSWLSTALFVGLQPECQKELYQSLSKLMYVVPSARLQEFLKGPVITGFNPSKGLSISEAILRGVLSALQVKDLPISVFGWMSSTLQQIYKSCSQDACAKFPFISELLAKCLAQVPLEQADKLTQKSSVKSILVRCGLVSNGQAPLKWLNICITWVLDSTNQDAADLMSWYIVGALSATQGFHHHRTDDRVSWFTDVISQIRITATSNQQKTSAETVTRGLTLLSGLAVYFSCSPLSLAIDASPLTGHQKETQTTSLEAVQSNLHELLRLLSCALAELMKSDPWGHITEKLLEWLFVIQGSSAVQSDCSLQNIIQECIVVFKDTEVFKKMSMWTEALTRIQGIMAHH
ncbi:focadhesin-like [Actinia tenebrosa]|uniref:Focadhesin-like n=1 Tax=Actinia tenebrosa TaxID=6105 RepID=A0A6P8IH15_ACTTE|nr:focadhesin-like [Actinia tenebrosa]